ncbi:glycosyltransferase [Streptacidiphilus sp. N1-12]|uniref:Glucosyl-3-phosphoglycerate synthase n=2 Tax=Streptacidiphilus alkalitolerans TaxID=3342712 RepID=A0ABV6WEX3_9ACTN
MDAQREPASNGAAGERDDRDSRDGQEGREEPLAAGAPGAADTPSAVAVVIPAHNEASRIALTVLAARRLPGVDLVVVVDAASTDSTARVAEESGAVVVRLGGKVGRTAALLRGIGQVADVDLPGTAPRHLLLLDADLQQSAGEAVRLLDPVLAGKADLVLAGAEPREASAARGASRFARRGIVRATGFTATRPLAAELCLTRAAFSAAEPLSEGSGAGPGLIIDLLRQGFRVVEIPVPWDHRASRSGLRARLREARRRREVRRALASR